MNYQKIALAVVAVGTFSLATYHFSNFKSETQKLINQSPIYTSNVHKCTHEGDNTLAKPVAVGCVFKTIFNEESSEGYLKFKTPENIQSAIDKGLKFALQAQHPNGGWGAGLHSMQHVMDAQAVKTDPATTSMIAMALLRCGSSLTEGEHAASLTKATKYLLNEVEETKNDPFITKERGTQIQVKLGENIDAVITAQFFSNLLTKTNDNHELVAKIKTALDICVKKIQNSQAANGSTSGGSWAGVLQSSMANSALEAAQVTGAKVDAKKLEEARKYQESNFNAETGETNTEDGAGIVLYSISSSARGSAVAAGNVREEIERAKKDGKIKKDAKVSVETLKEIGYNQDEATKLNTSYKVYEAAKTQAQTDAVMNGFGNNGGEEFISFLQTGESMVVGKDDSWKTWYDNVSAKMLAIQNADGSWNGHHCITSPAFCTATSLLILSINNDVDILSTMGGK